MKFGNTNYENMSNASLILKWHLALKKNVYEEPVGGIKNRLKISIFLWKKSCASR